MDREICFLGLTGEKTGQIKRTLRNYFPSKGMRPVLAYYSLLAALGDAGHQLDIRYFDYIRAIIQYGQYEQFLADPRSVTLPRVQLEEAVKARVTPMVKEMSCSLKTAEKVRIWLRRRLGG